METWLSTCCSLFTCQSDQTVRSLIIEYFWEDHMLLTLKSSHILKVDFSLFFIFSEYFLFTTAVYAPGAGASAMVLSPTIEFVPKQCFKFVFQMQVGLR